MAAKLVQRLRHAIFALIGGVGDVERHRTELVVGNLANGADALQVLVGENGMGRLNTRRYLTVMMGSAECVTHYHSCVDVCQ